MQMLRRYAGHLIQAGTLPEGAASSSQSSPPPAVIIELLDKALALEAEDTYVQLLEHFGARLQRETNLDQIDALLAAVLDNSQLSDGQRVTFADLRARVLVQLGERDLARKVLDAARPAAVTPASQATLLNRQGYLHAEYEEFAAAEAAYHGAIALARAGKDEARLSLLYNNLGELLYRIEQEERAHGYFQQAMQAADRAGSMPLLAMAEAGLAMNLDEMGRYEEANVYHERARTHYRTCADSFGEMRVDLNQAYQAYRRGEYAAMQSLAERALVQARDLHDLQRMAFAHHRLGQASLGLRRYELAVEHFAQALDGRILLGKPTFVRATAQNLRELAGIIRLDAGLDERRRKSLLGRCAALLKAAETQLPAAFK